MLMVTPAARLRLRSEMRAAPVTLPRLKCLEPRPKLPRHRREALVERLAGMMRTAEPTPFFMEGPGRAGIRSALCMQGWPWGQADAAAADVVETALGRVGATRPSWKAGQPEWTQDGALPIEHMHCRHCGRPLPEGQVKFCSPVCAKANRVHRYARYDKEAKAAHDAAWRAARNERRAAIERS